MRIRMMLMTVSAALIMTSVSFAGQCSDPWVTQAIQQVTNMPPIDNGNSGMCNTANYGGGRWNSYEQLLGYVKNYFSRCNDVWVTMAIVNITGKPPVDSGSSGACNIANYNGGRWSSYAELAGYVGNYFYKGPGSVSGNPLTTINRSGVAPSGISSNANPAALVNAGNRLIGDGGGTLIGNDGAGIVAAGGGN